MKGLFHLNRTIAITAIAAVALFTGCENRNDPVSSNGNDFAKGASSSTTSQSIGVAMNQLETDIVISYEAQTTYHFDRDCAHDHFVITQEIGNVDPATRNAAFSQAINNNKCTFWNGGALVGVTKAEGGGKNFKSVTVAPIPGQEVVDAHTCWTSEQIVDGQSSVDATVQPDVAGESLQLHNGGGSNFTKKFSFSLLDDSAYTRVIGVSYHLDKWNGTSWDEVATNDVGDLTNVESSAFWFMYVANGGVFGPATGSLVSGYTQGDIMNNTGGISGDDFAGNNSNVANAGSNAQVAHGPAWTNTISDPGQYRVRVTGTIKGNSGIATQPFAVTSNTLNITVGAPNCD